MASRRVISSSSNCNQSRGTTPEDVQVGRRDLTITVYVAEIFVEVLRFHVLEVLLHQLDVLDVDRVVLVDVAEVVLEGTDANVVDGGVGVDDTVPVADVFFLWLVVGFPGRLLEGGFDLLLTEVVVCREHQCDRPRRVWGSHRRSRQVVVLVVRHRT